MAENARIAIKTLLLQFALFPRFYKNLYSSETYPYESNWTQQKPVYTRVENTDKDDDDLYILKRYTQLCPQVFRVAEDVYYTIQGRLIQRGNSIADPMLSDSQMCSIHAINNCFQAMLFSQEQALWITEQIRKSEYERNAMSHRPLQTQMEYALLCHLARCQGIYMIPITIPPMFSTTFTLSFLDNNPKITRFIVSLQSSARQQTGHFLSIVKHGGNQWMVLDSLGRVEVISSCKDILTRRPKGAFCVILIPVTELEPVFHAAMTSSVTARDVFHQAARLPKNALIESWTLASLLRHAPPSSTFATKVDDDFPGGNLNIDEAMSLASGQSHPLWFASQSGMQLVDMEQAAEQLIAAASGGDDREDLRACINIFKSKILRTIWMFTETNPSIDCYVTRHRQSITDLYVCLLLFYHFASNDVVQSERAFAALSRSRLHALLSCLCQCIPTTHRYVDPEPDIVLAAAAEFYANDPVQLRFVRNITSATREMITYFMEIIHADMFRQYVDGTLSYDRIIQIVKNSAVADQDYMAGVERIYYRMNEIGDDSFRMTSTVESPSSTLTFPVVVVVGKGIPMRKVYSNQQK